MRYARIEADRVAELLDTTGDIRQLFPPALLWVLADAIVQPGWTYSGGTFAAPVAPPFNPQDSALAELTARTDAMQLVVTLLQADYLAAGDTVNAAACSTLKSQLDAVASDATVLATTTRAAFNAAARARIRAAVQAAPPAVRLRLSRDPSF